MTRSRGHFDPDLLNACVSKMVTDGTIHWKAYWGSGGSHAVNFGNANGSMFYNRNATSGVAC